MNVIKYPRAFQSAFRPALFVLDGAQATQDGTDVSILPAAGNEPLGVKRFYAGGEITINAAPYVRALLEPEPLCGQPAGMVCDQRRFAGCRVSAEGYTSAAVYLTAGTDNAPTAAILSAAPETVKIRPGEKDEIAVVGLSVKPFITFTHGGEEFTVDTIQAGSGTGMHTFVVDSDEAARMFAEKTGADASAMDGFSVVLRVSDSGGDTYLTRRYLFDGAPHNGRRLAWVNRYGAIDYYTFPATTRLTESGTKERIATGGGVRVVATSSAAALTLESECETAAALGWLAEILSSPKVWTVGGGSFAEVAADGAPAAFSPMLPGRIAVRISSVEHPVSRKL